MAGRLELRRVGATGGASGEQAIVGLITKTDTNPFFVKMKEGATAEAAEGGRCSCSPSRASRTATTSPRSQAIENLISAGAKGFMITPNDSKAIVPVAGQGQAGRACW